MSDTTYSEPSEKVNANIVTIAQTAKPDQILTKRNYTDHQKSYDQVKFFNLFEYEIWNLWDLYRLSKRMLDKPRCCFLRARIKDPDIRRNVVRKYLGPDATLIVPKQNWFALDIDGLGHCTGDLYIDTQSVLRALPFEFLGVECFSVASSSYGIKPDIRMRVFFWNHEPIDGADLKRTMHGNMAKADLAIFNPIQPIYTAAPIFIGRTDPVKERMIWITPYEQSYTCTNIQAIHERPQDRSEDRYTKDQAIAIVRKKSLEVGLIPEGERHDKLLDVSRLFGKLIWQQVIEEDYVVTMLETACDTWDGKRDRKKDSKTIYDGIQRGKQAMEQ